MIVHLHGAGFVFNDIDVQDIDVQDAVCRRLAIRCLGQVHGFWRHPQFAASEPLLRQGAAWVDQHLS